MAYTLKHALKATRLSSVYYRGYSTARPFILSEEVRSAKSEGKPIVALESTIITHGMPYPQNLETAVQVENIIRERGAIPATIAILKGQLTVGLTEEQIHYLSQAKDVVKASRRDLAPIAAAKLDGATTVAGTIIAAELAGIPVFVTGGIGGVHRQGENTLDVSADLNELGRSKTLVVCGGVKSILDIGRTLEYLETQGVCVCAFGESDDFPAFYTPKSGYKAPHRVPDALHAAKVLHEAYKLRLASGIVVAVPIPKEYAMDEQVIEECIQRALKEAEAKGIHGKEVTPFILSAVVKATDGASLSANIALIKNNARVGADIAREFKKLENVGDSGNAFNIGAGGKIGNSGKCTGGSVRGFHSGVRGEEALFQSEGDVLVIGGANVDRTYRLKEERAQLDGSTHACNIEQCGGGVGRNMAEALWRLRNGRAKLLTAVGDDADGRYVESIAPGLLLDGCIIKDARTPSYAALLDSRGECLLGLGDMALHDEITPDLVNKHLETLERTPLVVLDGNVPKVTIDHVLDICEALKKPVFFEPTDRRKASKILQNKHIIQYASPNLSELREMARFLNPDHNIAAQDDIKEIAELSSIVSNRIRFLLVTIGSRGVITINSASDTNKGGKIQSDLVFKLYPTKPLTWIENVSGAGDCFSSGVIHGILSGLPESQCISIGFKAAQMTLISKKTVSSSLNSINSSLHEEAHFTYI